MIHAGAYVADDLVFTENGEDVRQPCDVMHMEDMIDSYWSSIPKVAR